MLIICNVVVRGFKVCGMKVQNRFEQLVKLWFLDIALGLLWFFVEFSWKLALTLVKRPFQFLFAGFVVVCNGSLR